MVNFLEELIHLDSLKNVVVNLVGIPGSGKSTLAYNYAAQFLNKRKPVIYIALDHPPEQSLHIIKELTDTDYSVFNSLLTIVDGYYPTIGAKSKWNFSFNAANLSDFNLTLSKSLEQKVECAIIDPYSTLFIHNKESKLIQALQIGMAKLRRSANYSFILYEDGVHSQTFYNTIRFLGDINLTLKREETKRGEIIRELHVYSAREAHLDGARWPFMIDYQGRIKWVASEIHPNHPEV